MLEIMGVPPDVLSQRPANVDKKSYPPVFRESPEFRWVWSRLCLRAPTNDTVEVAWNTVLRKFLWWAKSANRNVFPDKATRVDNNEIQSYLMLRRRWVTQYIDKLGILKGVHWLHADQTVVEDALGITVNSSLHCRNIDYAALKAQLETDRWRPNLQRAVGYEMGYRDWWRWLKVSETGVTKIGFSAAGKERGIFWYSIVVPNHPFVPPNQTVEEFVLDDIWNPVVRTLRFHTLNRISKF